MSQRIEIWYLRLFLLLNKLILLRLGCMFNNLEKFREVSWCVVGVLVEAEGGETCLTHYYVAKPFFICTKSTMVWPFTNELGKMWLSLNCLIFWDIGKGLRVQVEIKLRWTLGLLIKIKPLSDQVENFIRVTVGPKNPKNAFKIAVSLTPKVRQNGPASLLPKSQPPKVGQSG